MSLVDFIDILELVSSLKSSFSSYQPTSNFAILDLYLAELLENLGTTYYSVSTYYHDKTYFMVTELYLLLASQEIQNSSTNLHLMI